MLSLVLTVCGLVPLFLLAFGWGMIGAGVATVLGEFIPLCIFFIMYFKGKFRIKPNLNQFLKPFSKHTWPAIRVGFSQLLANLSTSIPGIVMRKFLGLSISDESTFNNVLAGFNVLYRYSAIVTAVIIAFGMGYLPAGSYANADENPVRYLKLTIHLLWICGVWSIVTCLISQVIPRQISMMFGEDEDFIYWSTEFIRKGYVGGFVIFVRYNSQVMLQALGLGFRASILSLFSQLISLILAMFLLYYTNKHDPARLSYSYPLNYTFVIVLGAILVVGPILEQYRKTKTPVENELSSMAEEDAADDSFDK